MHGDCGASSTALMQNPMFVALPEAAKGYEDGEAQGRTRRRSDAPPSGRRHPARRFSDDTTLVTRPRNDKARTRRALRGAVAP